jgi:hypothetical protein
VSNESSDPNEFERFDNETEPMASSVSDGRSRAETAVNVRIGTAASDTADLASGRAAEANATEFMRANLKRKQR